MEKTLFVSTLKEKAGVDNLSERTYEEVANLFLPQFEDDSKITDESWGQPVQILKSMSGQLRHDLSGGIASFKTQFESEHKAAQDKAIADAVAAAKAEWEKVKGGNDGGSENGGGEGKDLDAKISKAITEAISSLTGEEGTLGRLTKQFSDYIKLQEEKEKNATEEQMRSEILELVMSFDGLDEDDVIVENTMLKLNIEKGKDMATLKNEAKSTYEKVYKKFVEKHGGAQSFNGGSGSGTDSGTEFQKFIKERMEKAEQEAKDAEELRKHMM